MIRRYSVMALAVAAFVLVGCGAGGDAVQARQAVETTAIAETAPASIEVAQATPVVATGGKLTARGIVVRRAEAFQNGTTHIHLMIRTNGPNDEKVYLSFSLSSAFAPAPLAQVGDRVEVTYIDRGFYEVHAMGITEPKFPEEAAK